MMHKNTHRLCDRCWDERRPGERPFSIKDDKEGPCCSCGQPTRSGIYVLERDRFDFCAGNHSEEPSEGLPYIGFSADTLGKLPDAREGDTVKCKYCGELHVLRAPERGGKDLLFFSCGGETHLGALGGKLVAFLDPDVSGGDSR